MASFIFITDNPFLYNNFYLKLKEFFLHQKFLILINLAFFIWFINEYKNDVYYEINNNGIFISFYNNSPNKREYEDFLNKIKENQNKKMNHNLKILN